ncbi:unnamed protein product [Caenorhabditis angaria]|uniref:Helicase C-terminal domain-containing protein n=1 Tax=Caenorhabditis angaria TaxID=860376 RepID=A0A9P1MUY4_9PELO|nr:unnamed protein product [Caenorhabditis angaria]
MDLTSEKEKSQVHKFFAQCIERLKGSDKQLPQVLTMRELCLRGFAVHHSGILPILKEVVELLFQQGYVKILFATETFAMGVNMPARCVVFDNIVKHDGTEKRVLNPGEYTQMAGRAGRRGLDTTGTVIVLCKENTVHQPDVLKQLMMGSALELKSKFRVTYSMLLNLLRVEQLKIEDMLKRSYVESSSLRESINLQLDSMSLLNCPICDNSIREFHSALSHFCRNRREIWPKMNREPAINKLLISGRFLIVNNVQNQLENEIVLLLKEMVNGQRRSLQILVAVKNLDTAIQLDQHADKFQKSLTDDEATWQTEESQILATAKYGTCGSRHDSDTTASLWNYRVCEVPVEAIVAVLKKQVKQLASSEIVQDYQRNMIPRFRSEEVSTNTMKILQQLSQVKTAMQNEEVEIYTYAELAANCQNIDLNMEVSFLGAREMELRDREKFGAQHCADFETHLLEHRQRVRVERRAEKLKFDLSSDALLLSEEYQNRLAVLQNLNFVEPNKMVSLKGRIACEIHHQELLITELILDNKFHSRPPAELAALLSTLTCQYNSGKERLKFEEGSVFNEIRDSVTAVMTRLESVAAKHKSQIADVGCEIRFDLMEVVYHWASGMPFSKIMELTDAQEGLIVKCIQRLDEVCKDVRNAGRIVGDPALVEKMEEVSASIRRDIVFAASLYTSV